VKPICVPCQRFFRPSRNGFAFIEGMPSGNDARPGLAEPDRWRPYKLWIGDQWKCPDCGATIIVGVAHQPVSEHYQPNFKDAVRQFGGDQLQINDC
jgi:hypothetical protein